MFIRYASRQVRSHISKLGANDRKGVSCAAEFHEGLTNPPRSAQVKRPKTHGDVGKLVAPVLERDLLQNKTSQTDPNSKNKLIHMRNPPENRSLEPNTTGDDSMVRIFVQQAAGRRFYWSSRCLFFSYLNGFAFLYIIRLLDPPQTISFRFSHRSPHRRSRIFNATSSTELPNKRICISKFRSSVNIQALCVQEIMFYSPTIS